MKGNKVEVIKPPKFVFMADSTHPPLPAIPPEALMPWADALLEIIEWQNRRISALDDEIHRLKKGTRKPPPPPSQMEKGTEPPDKVAATKKKGPQRQETALLEIHEERIIQPEAIPPGSRFKGYRDVVVQDLLIQAPCHPLPTGGLPNPGWQLRGWQVTRHYPWRALGENPAGLPPVPVPPPARHPAAIAGTGA
ncbi:MAG: hypothetical protein KJ675_16970 [Gammaproteobacteria bacterium]|nr:hypothetical protein [Gammaproteobacteria bacterium]